MSTIKEMDKYFAEAAAKVLESVERTWRTKSPWSALLPTEPKIDECGNIITPAWEPLKYNAGDYVGEVRWVNVQEDKP